MANESRQPAEKAKELGEKTFPAKRARFSFGVHKRSPLGQKQDVESGKLVVVCSFEIPRTEDFTLSEA